MKRLILFILLMNVLELYAQNIVEEKSTSSTLCDKYSFFKEPYNPFKNNGLSMSLPECNYMYVYDKSITTYHYYLTNFNIYDYQYLKTKRDILNPYGVHKPQLAVVFGLLNLALKKIQE
jgi:hypothetical protein